MFISETNAFFVKYLPLKTPSTLQGEFTYVKDL